MKRVSVTEIKNIGLLGKTFKGILAKDEESLTYVIYGDLIVIHSAGFSVLNF
jgi:hypothetical protein